MINIAANELKIKGVSVLQSAFESNDEAVITVRGKQKYVVVELEKYYKLCQHELEAALLEARNDIANGDFVKESITEHMRRITP